MRNRIRASRRPAGALLASVGIAASGAGLVLAFQEPPGVSSRPIDASNINVPAELLPAANAPAAPLATERPDDVAAIRGLTTSFIQAFNAGDSAAIARLFTENARIIDEENQISEGRAAISARFAKRFSEQPGETLAVTPEAIRFLGPDTAIEEGTATIQPPVVEGEKVPPTAEITRYTVVYVRRDGTWLHASIRDQLADVASGYAQAGNSNYEHLRPLEWLVGDWVEEGSDIVLTSSFAWSDNRNFLIRTFRLQVPGRPAVTGTQRIGWDPSIRQIRSWEFDSDGSFGEGIWSRRGDEWVIKMNGVRHDGRVASDTRVIVRTGSDHLSWRAVDRTLADEVQEDTPEFVMVRRAPVPGEAKVKRVSQ